jgi:uncharacterized protein YdiU (UPF0061 family)
MSEWMRVGFVHGVMNTDNLSILGLTIDYGPFGWIEPLDFSWTPNTTDREYRRYRFGAQPEIGFWNLVRLAEALAPLLGGDDRSREKALRAVLEKYPAAFEKHMDQVWCKKLGLEVPHPQLTQELLEIFTHAELDFTLFLHSLSRVLYDFSQGGHPGHASELALQMVKVASYTPENDPKFQLSVQALTRWLEHRIQVGGPLPFSRVQTMRDAQPAYVPRNFLLQEAIDDLAKLEPLMTRLRDPYLVPAAPEELHREFLDPKYFARRPEWARERAGCSMLSCSS